MFPRRHKATERAPISTPQLGCFPGTMPGEQQAFHSINDKPIGDCFSHPKTTRLPGKPGWNELQAQGGRDGPQ